MKVGMMVGRREGEGGRSREGTFIIFRVYIVELSFVPIQRRCETTVFRGEIAAEFCFILKSNVRVNDDIRGFR
jgi:hypothetical protein